jgi:hypothetical protein
MPLTTQDKERCRYHLGYINARVAPAMAMGMIRLMQTQFLVEATFETLLEESVPRVLSILEIMDNIEKQQVNALMRIKASKLDTLTLRDDEHERLDKEYAKWGYKLANILGCMPYPFSQRYYQSAFSSGVTCIPVRQ